MARKEERQEGAKSYSYENPATGRDYCGGFYCDYCTPYHEALWHNGVHNAFLTKEDGDIHVRWEYDINRNVPRQTSSENDGVMSEIL